MIELASLPPTAQAALLVAVVTVEAVAFYVAYGALERAIGPSVIEKIGTV